MMFPKPPLSCLEAVEPHFEASEDLRDWATETFIKGPGKLINEDHEHLVEANILFLWASYPELRNGQQVAGTAECYRPKAKRWADGREFELIRSFWYRPDEDPDFIVTLSAPYVRFASAAGICALVEHELYHCGQQKDRNGEPKFMGGRPQWALRGHDVEEFIGVARRYGAVNTGLVALHEALSRPPLFKRSVTDDAVCGCGAAI